MVIWGNSFKSKYNPPPPKKNLQTFIASVIFLRNNDDYPSMDDAEYCKYVDILQVET